MDIYARFDVIVSRSFDRHYPSKVSSVKWSFNLKSVVLIEFGC